MRTVHVFALILFLPAAYLGYNDYVNHTPGQPIKLATVGEVWMDHDRAWFNDFKSSYANREAEWTQNVRPYLELTAVPIALVPPLLFSLWLLIAFMLGIGPYRDLDLTKVVGIEDERGSIARNQKRGDGRVKYTRR